MHDRNPIEIVLADQSTPVLSQEGVSLKQPIITEGRSTPPGAGRETDRKLHEALVQPGGDRPIFTRWCRIVRTSLGSVITAITFRDEWKCGHSRANDPESVRGSFLNCDRRLSASLPPHRVASGIVPSNAQQNPKQGCSGFCCVLGAGIS
jgi:hypothetical protein